MPFNILLRLALVAILLLLLVNVVIPLIFPRYPLFWVFRGKRAKALRDLDNAAERQEVENLQKKTTQTLTPSATPLPEKKEEEHTPHE